MKRVTIVASGTRGDVQPAVALARALVDNGHQVSVFAGRDFTEWIEASGETAAPTEISFRKLMESVGGQEWVEKGHNPLVQARLMKRLVDSYGWQMVWDTWRACQEADVIISIFTSDTYVTAIAEKVGARQVSMALQPALIPTRDGRAIPSAPLPNRISVLNLCFSNLFIEPFPWKLYGPLTIRLRNELGLPPQSAKRNLAVRRQMQTLQAYSRSVVPHPNDWPANVHTTGYWFLERDPEWEPPFELFSFLKAGKPPVYIGFGSMTGRKRDHTTQLILDGIAMSGQRAIVASGWAGLGRVSLPKEVFQVDAVPHDWLFPRVAAVVHHGGAGTVAAGVAAGAPTLVVPHFADQPFWGQRIYDLGVGPRPIPRHKLSAENLA